jgi:hypothetical protein
VARGFLATGFPAIDSIGAAIERNIVATFWATPTASIQIAQNTLGARLAVSGIAREKPRSRPNLCQNSRATICGFVE